MENLKEIKKLNHLFISNLLLIGSGGREHAIAWKLSQASKVQNIYVCPGNGGTRNIQKVSNVSLSLDNQFQEVIQFCKEKSIQIVIVGPEQPLVDGITDFLQASGITCFGPSREASKIEASKVFAKEFMIRHNIPTARYQSFNNYELALEYIRNLNYPFVLKASGLAAGKGVILPETLQEAEEALKAMMVSKIFGSASEQVVIEERLEGPEVSVLAFSDGENICIMPPAQDHKRIFDGDKGPNTGGMGAYAPAPLLNEASLQDIETRVIKPAILGMKKEGKPFVGILFAGLMMTKNGPYTLEFNCRFGDPETQVILPLLETDLLSIVEHCIKGTLNQLEVKWKQHQTAVTVVLASEGYPNNYPKGREISGAENIELHSKEGVIVFHAGTTFKDGKLVTSGGRVLAVTAQASSLKLAIEQAYKVVNQISFEGCQFRKDIAQKAFL